MNAAVFPLEIIEEDLEHIGGQTEEAQDEEGAPARLEIVADGHGPENDEIRDPVEIKVEVGPEAGAVLCGPGQHAVGRVEQRAGVDEEAGDNEAVRDSR